MREAVGRRLTVERPELLTPLPLFLVGGREFLFPAFLTVNWGHPALGQERELLAGAVVVDEYLTALIQRRRAPPARRRVWPGIGGSECASEGACGLRARKNPAPVRPGGFAVYALCGLPSL